jgi:hypothetical protein
MSGYFSLPGPSREYIKMCRIGPARKLVRQQQFAVLLHRRRKRARACYALLFKEIEIHKKRIVFGSSPQMRQTMKNGAAMATNKKQKAPT